MKALIVGTQRDQVTKAQWEPFFYYRKQLKQELGLEIQTQIAETFSEIAQVCQANPSDVIFMIPFWRENANEAESAIAPIKQTNPQRKVIFIDPWAQASSRYFNLLPYVDYFLKRQRYSHLENYHKNFLGGTMLTDFLARNYDYDLEGWDVSSNVSPSYINRIHSGWNLGTAKKIKKQIDSPNWFQQFNPKKTIDIFCRLSLGKSNDWYSRYRRESVEALKPLEKSYKVALSGKTQGDLVSRRQYYRELKRSKIVFSPFGWGENCWRDFEAICHNCLLVKPSMAHLDTQPNLFLEGKTYIEINWHYSDLEDKINYYLQNWDEAQAIIKNARQVYHTYFKKQQFIRKIEAMINE